MNQPEIISLVRNIVRQARELKNEHTTEKDAPVSYACVFSQNEDEYEKLVRAAEMIGTILKQTPTGLLFKIRPIETVSGKLRLLKIRMPDPTRPERGDADFNVSDYRTFKEMYLNKPGFKLIPRENLEMIELMDPKFNVRVYFSNPPVDQQY